MVATCNGYGSFRRNVFAFLAPMGPLFNSCIQCAASCPIVDCCNDPHLPFGVSGVGLYDSQSMIYWVNHRICVHRVSMDVVENLANFRPTFNPGPRVRTTSTCTVILKTSSHPMRSKSETERRAAIAAEMDAYVAMSYDVLGARSDSKMDRTAMVEHSRDSGHAAWIQLISYRFERIDPQSRVLNHFL